MAFSNRSTSPHSEPSSPARTLVEQLQRRASCPSSEKTLDESIIVQGRVLWLPAKNELPIKAVRRAHGKGAVEEGIYNHPVVIISRPADDTHLVHFHLVSTM